MLRTAVHTFNHALHSRLYASTQLFLVLALAIRADACCALPPALLALLLPRISGRRDGSRCIHVGVIIPAGQQRGHKSHHKRHYLPQQAAPAARGRAACGGSRRLACRRRGCRLRPGCLVGCRLGGSGSYSSAMLLRRSARRSIARRGWQRERQDELTHGRPPRSDIEERRAPQHDGQPVPREVLGEGGT